MADTISVSGDIVLPQGDLPDRAAAILVVVEDVSRADAPSIVVGEQRQTGVRLRGGQTVPFRVEVPAGRIEPRNLYAVRVHVDVAGSGEVRRGDFVSTLSHPVITRGYGRAARVPVRRV